MTILITCSILTLLCAGGILAGKWLKPLAGRVRIGFIAATVALALLSGFVAKNMLDTTNAQRQSAFLALKYLSDGNTEMAKIKIGGMSVGGDNSFSENAANYMLSALSGDTGSAMRALTLLQGSTGGNADKQTLVDFVSTADVKVPANREKAAAYLLNLDFKKPPDEWVLLYELEQAAVTNHSVQQEKLEAYSKKYGENKGKQLGVQLYLAAGNANRAFELALELVDKNGSAQNRMLLAEAMAQIYYSGGEVRPDAFVTDESAEIKPDAEQAALKKQNDKLSEEIAKLDSQIAIEMDEGKIKTITEKRDKLVITQSESAKKEENILLYRAINSIEGVGGIEQDIMSAKLYFAAGDSKKATETVKNVAANKSWQAKTPAMRATMGRVATALNATPAPDDSGLLADDLNNLLRLTGTGMAPQGLANDLSAALLSSVKYNASLLRVAAVNTSEFPKLTVTVSGSEDLLKRIKDKSGITAKDTRTKIDYTVHEKSNDSPRVTTCFVVDESGSMDGAPIQNAKDALTETIKTIAGGMDTALVGFSSTARTITPISNDLSDFMSGINNLGLGGGTDITSGIVQGLQALEGAQSASSIILMTDGQSSGSVQLLEALELAKSRGIPIYTIGFGSVDDDMLSLIADSTGGQYIKAANSAELTSIYNMLQSYVSNTVDVSYTVPEPTTAQERYVYFLVEDAGYYARKKYSLDTELASTAPTVQVSALFPGAIETAQAQNESIFRLDGIGLDTVQKVLVNDVTLTISTQAVDRISAKYEGALAPGVYPMSLVLADGTVLEIPAAFAVGEPFSYGILRVGNLELSSSQAVQLSPSELAFGSLRINESSICDGLVTLRLPAPIVVDPTVYGPIDLGDSGTMQGSFALYTPRNNYYSILKQPSGRGSNKVYLSDGKFLCTIGANESTIVSQNKQEEVVIP